MTKNWDHFVFTALKGTGASGGHRCDTSAALCSVLYKKTYRKDLEVLDLLMVAQGEHERPGITLAVPQQE